MFVFRDGIFRLGERCDHGAEDASELKIKFVACPRNNCIALTGNSIGIGTARRDLGQQGLER